eukprot:scaffold6002_cov376-Prasinococcus_capsulatus_cf.AAC.1
MSRSSDGASKCVLVGEGALPRLQNILWAEEFFVGQDAAADAAAPSAAGGPRQAREEGASALTYTMSLPGTWPTHGLSIGWRASSGGAGAAALNMSEAVESWQLRPVPINEGEVGVRRVVAAAAGADEEEVRATGIELWDVQLKEVRSTVFAAVLRGGHSSPSHPLWRSTSDRAWPCSSCRSRRPCLTRWPVTPAALRQDKEWVFACKARDEAPPTMALYIVHGVGIFSEGNQKPVGGAANEARGSFRGRGGGSGGGVQHGDGEGPVASLRDTALSVVCALLLRPAVPADSLGARVVGESCEVRLV